ncbi:NUDIX hydrolase [Patescibacteria group bacterium]|nr:NUDIX hydrolase [Patescibacteria group bacterium]
MKINKPPSKQPLPAKAELVFKGKIFDVYQWEEIGYDGQPMVFEKLKRPDTAAIIAVTDEGKIILTKQEQPARLEPFIGLIGGRVDEGETPLEAANRELLEEAGFVCTDWQLLRSEQPVSKIEWAIYYFVARGCRRVAKQNLDSGEKIELIETGYDEFKKMVLDKEFDYGSLRTIFLEAELDKNKADELRKILVGK